MKRLSLLGLLLLFANGCGGSTGEELMPNDETSKPELGFAENKSISGASLYRGFSAVESLLSERIFESSRKERHLALRHVPFSLTELLGGYQGTGLQNTFVNGSPNPLNMMIWLAALQGFGHDLGSLCTETIESEEAAEQIRLLRQRLKLEVSSTIDELCQWQQPDFQPDTFMSRLWYSLIGYDAPSSEKAAWTLYFSSTEYRDVAAPEAIEAMIVGALYTPFFLLDQ